MGALNLRHHIDTPFLTNEAGHIGYDVAPSARRKGIGREMLRLGLIEAKRLGLKRVLLVADSDNHASRRVIESNGGVFESTITGEYFPLYWHATGLIFNHKDLRCKLRFWMITKMWCVA